MKINVVAASMKKEADGSFLGKTIFQANEDPTKYEITFFSKRGKDWDYSLHYADEPGNEELLLAVDAHIEQSDEDFDQLLDAAWNSMDETDI
ncbi:hypothetical protein J2Z32_000543 [Paenibacillus turicensis]|uniref:DUF1292 domain-containing protein n=1 Tax=Paenibacillus turicensis TaxID=160487 RepID=A0ABS4FMW6_9BACL|nr:hypothetical protein [Paenibacillus turicensis]MBP1903926.1 hypothetical protein [Paenibacillus turicensis]